MVCALSSPVRRPVWGLRPRYSKAGARIVSTIPRQKAEATADLYRAAEVVVRARLA